MSKYVCISGGNDEELIYPVDTLEQIEQAEEVLREHGLTEAEVWTSPLSIEEILEGCGDPEGHKNGQRVFVR